MDNLRKEAYLQILRCALLNTRVLGAKGRAKECAIEADHVHNIPELLITGNAGMEKYYWEVESRIYLEEADPQYAAVFEPFWEILGRANLGPE